MKLQSLFSIKKETHLWVIVVLIFLMILSISSVVYISVDSNIRAKSFTVLSEEDNKTFQEAKKLYLLNDLAGSINLFEAVVNKNRNFINGYFMLGKAYFFNNEIDKASDIWKKALKKEPNHINSLLWLGIMESYNLETRLLAKNYFFRILELDSQNILANYHLGKIYLEDGEYQKAIYYFNNSIENEMHLAEVYLDFGKLYQLVESNDRALNLFTKAGLLTRSRGIREESESLISNLRGGLN